MITCNILNEYKFIIFHVILTQSLTIKDQEETGLRLHILHASPHAQFAPGL
jgi:hypothetical protein